MCRVWSQQFDAMAAVVKQMAQMSMLDKLRTLTGLGQAAAFNPAADRGLKVGTESGSSRRRKSSKS
jgi:hypothetical protein